MNGSRALIGAATNMIIMNSSIAFQKLAERVCAHGGGKRFGGVEQRGCMRPGGARGGGGGGEGPVGGAQA